MSYQPYKPVHFTEFYLANPDKLAALEPEKQKFFWGQRYWHPVIRFNWLSGISSDGEGLLTYPDGSTRAY